MGGPEWSCKKAGALASAKRTCYCCLSPNFEYFSHLIANFVISEYVLKHSFLNLSSFFKKTIIAYLRPPQTPFSQGNSHSLGCTIPKNTRCLLTQGHRGRAATSAGLTLLLLLVPENKRSSVHFLLQQNAWGAGDGTEEG